MVILIAMANNLGIWIRDGLSELGETQAWLANRVGVEPPQISRIISGESEARPDLLNKIADALHKPRIQAYRAAGHLSTIPENDEWVEEMDYKIRYIQNPSRRKIAESLINTLLADEEAERAAKPKRKPAGT